MKLSEFVQHLQKIEQQVGPDAEVMMETAYEDALVRSLSWTRTLTTHISSQNPAGTTIATAKVLIES